MGSLLASKIRGEILKEMGLGFVIFALSLLSEEVCLAQNHTANRANSDLVAFEIELGPEAFARLSPWLDWNNLLGAMEQNGPWQDLIDPRTLDEYILRPGVLNQIPKPLRDQLAEGLVLPRSQSLIVPESPDLVREQPVLSSDGKELKHQTGVIYERDKIAPHGGVFKEPNSNSKLIRPNRPKFEEEQKAFEELAKRWRQLPVKQRRELVLFEHLNDLDRARLISKVDFPAKTVLNHFFQFKPGRVRDLLAGFNVTLDGRAGYRVIELISKVPSSDAEAAFAELKQICALTGTSQMLLDPLNAPKTMGSVHLHASFDASRVQVNRMEELWAEYRKLQLLRLLDHRPDNGDFYLIPNQGDNVLNTYEIELSGKGLVRWVDLTHGEVRQHALPIQDEWIELKKWAGNVGSSLQEIRDKQSAILKKNSKIFQKILEVNPVVALDFKDVLPGGERATYAHVEDAVLRNLGKEPLKVLRDINRILRPGASSSEVRLALNIAVQVPNGDGMEIFSAGLPSVSSEVQKEIVQAMATRTEQLREHSIAYLKSLPSGPERDRILDQIKNSIFTSLKKLSKRNHTKFYEVIQRASLLFRDDRGPDFEEFKRLLADQVALLQPKDQELLMSYYVLGSDSRYSGSFAYLGQNKELLHQAIRKYLVHTDKMLQSRAWSLATVFANVKRHFTAEQRASLTPVVQKLSRFIALGDPGILALSPSELKLTRFLLENTDIEDPVFYERLVGAFDDYPTQTRQMIEMLAPRSSKAKKYLSWTLKMIKTRQAGYPQGSALEDRLARDLRNILGCGPDSTRQ